MNSRSVQKKPSGIELLGFHGFLKAKKTMNKLTSPSVSSSALTNSDDDEVYFDKNLLTQINLLSDYLIRGLIILLFLSRNFWTKNVRKLIKTQKTDSSLVSNKKFKSKIPSSDCVPGWGQVTWTKMTKNCPAYDIPNKKGSGYRTACGSFNLISYSTTSCSVNVIVTHKESAVSLVET